MTVPTRGLVSGLAFGHKRGLDGLRGVAVASVLVYHTGLIRGGFLGVDVFFALSGFLITSLMLEEHAATGAINLRAFYARRGLRLLPALFTFLAVSGVYLLVTLPPAFWPLAGTYIAVVAFYVANWAGIWWYRLGIFGHTWSLAIEEQFYLVWPLAILLLLRFVRRERRVAWLLVAMAAASVMWRVNLALGGAPERRIYWATDAHSDGLLIGAAFAFFLARGGFDRFPRALRGIGAFSAIGLTAMLVTIPHNPYYAYGVTTLAALATAVMIVAVLTESRSALSRVLETRVLVGTGRISYALYLWHFPIFHTLGVLKRPGEHAPWADALLAWGLTFVAAVASYFLIERPALAYKDQFTWRGHAMAEGVIKDGLSSRPKEVPAVSMLL
jgi:peptidoglycan/LPS O-acetylase OafA/YrhL